MYDKEPLGLVAACEQLIRAWEDYLRDPDNLGWYIEGIISDAREAIEIEDARKKEPQ